MIWQANDDHHYSKKFIVFLTGFKISCNLFGPFVFQLDKHPSLQHLVNTISLKSAFLIHTNRCIYYVLILWSRKFILKLQGLLLKKKKIKIIFEVAIMSTKEPMILKWVFPIVHSKITFHFRSGIDNT